ncbi:DUF3008 family protein [Paracoccus aestuariivivens]|uniref:DUF3008 family protein n=1 Tax=Paracoccus aestuariivivens TaxID=1820333 RepID=A0A6L6J487_9RHOB|nr:DUF3008 family protein [Paracoccus aestuariivivens]
MPAKSKAQQKAAGAALSAKRGDTKKGELRGASKEMFASMSEAKLEDLAKTKHRGKPEHVAKKVIRRAVEPPTVAERSGPWFDDVDVNCVDPLDAGFDPVTGNDRADACRSSCKNQIART